MAEKSSVEATQTELFSWGLFWTTSLTLTVVLLTIDQSLPWYFGFESKESLLGKPAIWVAAFYLLTFPLQLFFYFYLKKNSHLSRDKSRRAMLVARGVLLLIFFLVT